MKKKNIIRGRTGNSNYASEGKHFDAQNTHINIDMCKFKYKNWL